ncbi:MAG TPA: 2-oxo acid dehydrogenase subunit E2, partial [Gemmataceae bacterium]|nr:2-oxo acid dehydrogenase subunit E2 [Gemmataceae bacterium]
VILTESGAPATKPVAAAAKQVEVDGHHETPPPPPPTSRPAARRLTRDGQGEAAVPAGPATRRLARELGVDLHEITGSAPGGRVTPDDVKAFVRGLPKRQAAAQPVASPAVAVPALPDFSKYGPVERKPFSALRKAIAKNLSISWNVAPQVTQHDLADVTELEASRKRALERAGKDSPKITMTVLAVKACVASLKAFPHFNSSYDANAGENGELILKRYFHIGIAVDTERGLVVPVIRDADKKSVRDLAREMTELAEKARTGKLTLDEMRGGTFTITNLGGIGGIAFSPIINYPEVAILGLSKSSWQPVVRDNKIEPRLMLPLSVTYDHRVIDGADGARFTAWLAAWFSDPGRTLMES